MFLRAYLHLFNFIVDSILTIPCLFNYHKYDVIITKHRVNCSTPNITRYFCDTTFAHGFEIKDAATIKNYKCKRCGAEHWHMNHLGTQKGKCPHHINFTTI